MATLPVRIKLLRDTARLPAYQSEHAVGCDLYADLPTPVELSPGERRLIPTGIAIEPADNVAVLLFARSGLASKHGIALANSVGVVDPDYRGEIMVALINHSDTPYVIHHGERIAQMGFFPFLQADFLPADDLSQTERGSGGFGHTGKG